MFETGYVFERDIEALGLSIEEAVKTYSLVEIEGMYCGIRAFYKRSSDPIFGEMKVSPSMNIYLQYYLGMGFEFGYYKGFCALNPLGLSTQVCFSLDIYSVLVSSEICLDVQGSKLRVYPLESYTSNGVLEEMYIEALNNYLGCIDYDSISVRNTMKANNVDMQVISAGLNIKAREWLGVR